MAAAAAATVPPNGISVCAGLDNLLGGGGVRLGSITEVVGDKGVGKSTLCKQLCLNVQTPKAFGGQEGEAILIKTEPDYKPKRMEELADAFGLGIYALSWLNNIKKTTGVEVEDVLSKIHVRYCYDPYELTVLVRGLAAFIRDQHPNVKLIVIDSIAFPFYGVDWMKGERKEMSQEIASILKSILQQFNLAIFLVNNLTCLIGEDGRSTLVPFLGEPWKTVADERIMMTFGNGRRLAHLDKSIHRPAAVGTYVRIAIDECGIADA